MIELEIIGEIEEIKEIKKIKVMLKIEDKKNRKMEKQKR